jgi:hypothetical protein
MGCVSGKDKKGAGAGEEGKKVKEGKEGVPKAAAAAPSFKKLTADE